MSSLSEDIASTGLSERRVVSDILSEYEYKITNIDEEIKIFEAAKERFKCAAFVVGGMPGDRIDTEYPYKEKLVKTIKHSAWDKLYKVANFDMVLSAKDKDKFQSALSSPPEFTIDNIAVTFGDYIKNPRASILRGLAEVFAGLDPYYKSHEKVKVGVKGIPKRVIIEGVSTWFGSGKDRLRDILNALAAYQGIPLVEHREMLALIEDGEFLKEANEIVISRDETMITPARGVWLKTYGNGNGHLYFNSKALKDINAALAEYYGEVLPDAPEKAGKKRQSTEVSKDLQYYPTPKNIVEHYLADLHVEDLLILEPSCGCGRVLDHVKSKGGKAFGIEYDQSRVNECRSKGHNVRQANFLEVEPEPIYDAVLMNPPFYGKHYAKHVLHAFKFLYENGILKAILPSTARYDHGLLEEFAKNNSGTWIDLPVGSFAESGTNISTSILTVRNYSRARQKN